MPAERPLWLARLLSWFLHSLFDSTPWLVVIPVASRKVKMRPAEFAARAVLAPLVARLPMSPMSPAQHGLTRRSGSCGTEVACGANNCMPVGSTCCT